MSIGDFVTFPKQHYIITPEKITEYIPLKECIDNHLYIIQARNSNLGIFNEHNSSFTISRFKFSLNYLFEELHWDTGEPYGTVKPLKVLGPTRLSFLPEMSEDEKLKFLNKRQIELKDEIRIVFEEIERNIKC